jgi:hypothetical protein
MARTDGKDYPAVAIYPKPSYAEKAQMFPADLDCRQALGRLKTLVGEQ